MTQNWNEATILERYRASANSTKSYTWFNYQPINLPGYEETFSLAGRDCSDRAKAIATQLTQQFGERRLRIIDWGCNLGFFCFELAKLGHEVVGVDRNRDIVEVCRYLARTNEFEVRPQFFCDEISPHALLNYDHFDVAISFSLFHHLGKQQIPILKQFSEIYPTAFIEMDGADFGYNVLFPFYWELTDVVETNDPYGSGTRKRKTWLCNSLSDQYHYQNIKEHNILSGRGVFQKKSQSNGIKTVVKREILGSKHTWINTNLQHEINTYDKNQGSRFFPKLLASGTNDKYSWMELEYVQRDDSASEEELKQFFSYLQNENQFLLDLSSDSFLFQNGALKVVDLESLMPTGSSIESLIRERTKKSSIRLDQYDKQLDYLLKRFKL